MTEYNRGIKAGFWAGLIFGIINTVITAVIILIISQPTSGIGNIIYTYIIGATITTSIFSGIIGGIIFGVIYAAGYNALPGSTSIKKAWVLAVIYWLIFSVLIGYCRSTNFGMTFYYGSILLGLILYLFWGFLLGTFWERYGT